MDLESAGRPAFFLFQRMIGASFQNKPGKSGQFVENSIIIPKKVLILFIK